MEKNSFNTTNLEAEGRPNTKFLGLDVNLPVFSISTGLAIIFSVLVLIFPDESYKILQGIKDFVVNTFGTLFTVSMSVITLVFFLFFLVSLVY